MEIKTGDFVKPTKRELRFVLDKTWYLVEGIRKYNKNSRMIKLKGHTLYFNSDDFEIIHIKGCKICGCEPSQKTGKCLCDYSEVL